MQIFQVDWTFYDAFFRINKVHKNPIEKIEDLYLCVKDHQIADIKCTPETIVARIARFYFRLN
jgi:hypothetical protein